MAATASLGGLQRQSPTLIYGSSLFASQRCLWGKLFGGASAKAPPPTTTDDEPITEDGQRMVNACLYLLESCGHNAQVELASSTKELIWELSDVLLHNDRRHPAEQFDLIYAALCQPDIHGNMEMRRTLMEVLFEVVPEPLYRVFESVNFILPDADAQSDERKAVLRTFVHAVLGQVRAPDGLTEDEVLLVYMDDLQTAFPLVQHAPSFETLKEQAAELAMKAKLLSLLSRLCVEFDRERTGKVQLAELQATADRVLGKEKATALLQPAKADAEGFIRYGQLASLLTRQGARE